MPKPRVMIVEDDILIAESTRLLLEELGYDVLSIESDGADAVKRERMDMPDVILMDVTLGGKMNGVEAANRIRTHSEVPIIFVTGFSEVRLMHFQDKQSYFYLSKPYTSDELHAIIKNALSSVYSIGSRKNKPPPNAG